MNRPDLVRAHIVRSMQSLKSYISCIPGNEAHVERLRGEEGEKRLARIIGFVMSELGNETEAPVESPTSQVRRAVNRVRGPKGE